MRVDLNGRRALVVGASGRLTDALLAALQANGAVAAALSAGGDVDSLPDLLVLVHGLKASDDDDTRLTVLAGTAGERMAERGSGRIVHLLSAAGLVPMRRHPQHSAAAASAVFAMRALAMRLGPGVQVNAVGAGAVKDGPDQLIAGDHAMLSHVPDGRAGQLGHLIDAALFLCDPANTYMTGQVLTVDGGWSAGYGRNF